MSKRIMVLFAVSAVAATLVIAGCSCSSASSNAATSASGSSASSSAASSTSASASTSASESASAASSSESSSAAATTTIANPWTDVSTADEAAKGAGLSSFTVPNTAKVGAVSYADPHFSYMEGLAQATYESPAAELTIRKSATREGIDLTGDYNEYPYEWAQNIKGLEVTCHGNEKGSAILVEWAFNDANYCLLSLGLGGEDLAMTADEVTTIVSGVF